MWVHKQFAVALMLMLCLFIGMFSLTCDITVGLWFAVAVYSW